MSSPRPQPASNPSSGQHAEERKDEEVNVEHAIEQAKRAFALKKYEQAVEWYGKALEVV
jgi:HAT1-interacting factor 1